MDGYGFKKINKEDLGRLLELEDYQYKGPENSIINIYKLHGSLGWIYDWSKKQIILYSMPNYFPGYHGMFAEKEYYNIYDEWTEGSTFIEPSYIKLFESPSILDIWKKSSQEIHNAEELFIVGYSLPEADTAAKIFLTTSIFNSRISSITIIDPCQRVLSKYKDLFGSVANIQKKTFDQWVNEDF